MEIKIIISDTGAGGTVSTQANDVDSTGVAGQQVAPSPEILRAAIGAIDAGPAPGAAGSTEFGAPPPFSSGNDLKDIKTSLGTSAGPSVAAMPVSGSVVETVAGPGENVNE